MFKFLLMLQAIVAISSYTPKVIIKSFPSNERRDTTDNIVVIHYDSSPSANMTIRYLKRKRNAYHYIIDRSGLVYKLIDPKYEARHAGLSYYNGYVRLNHYSIGVCLVNNGHVVYTEKQYQSLAWLIKTLQKRYPDIDSTKIVGHSDVAFPKGRKQDPGQYFDWAKFRLLING